MLTDPTEDYARGFVPFLDCTIYLDSRPLIPRSETEYWTEKALAHIKTYTSIYGGIGKNPTRVLDLFAGSGAIGVTVLKHLPEALVDFGEIHPAHVPTIEKNILENGIAPERARVIETDVWSNIHESYDFVLANPPYLSKERPDKVQASVLEHEPHAALFAEDGGFSLIEKTIVGLPTHVRRNGALYIEHEPEHAKRIEEEAARNNCRAHTFPDQYASLRYSIVSLV